MFEKIVVVTHKTRLEELILRFNSRAQAKFYIEHAGGDFCDYEKEHAIYQTALESAHRALDTGLKLQFIERSFLSTFLFTEKDLIVAIGQDGLVANTAKYVGAQPIIAVNPDPARFDGILLPFRKEQLRLSVDRVLEKKAKTVKVSLAEVRLNDGQRLLAFNDLFIGARTHVSARYRIELAGRSENHSSSGVIVSTGAGSTGWLSSIFNMAAAVSQATGGKSGDSIRLPWQDKRLFYVVREPFISKYSQAGLVAGLLAEGEQLLLESMMPISGTIFSDGIESDFIEFNSGAIASIGRAAQQANLVV